MTGSSSTLRKPVLGRVSRGRMRWISGLAKSRNCCARPRANSSTPNATAASCASAWRPRRRSPTSSGGKLAEQGWLGIVYPEEDGGSGLGLVDLVVLMEEMGRRVMPGPFFSTVLLGGAAIAEAGSPAQRREWLPRIAAGETKAALAWTEPAAALGRCRHHPAGARSRRRVHPLRHQALRRRRPSRRYRWSSPRAPATAARWRTGSACSWCRGTRRASTVAVMPTIDETRKLCEVRFDNVALPAAALLGEMHQGWAPLSRVVDARDRGALRRDVRRGAAGARHDRRLRQIARRLRQADRQLSGGQAPGGRYAGRDRKRQIADLLRRLGGRPGRGRGAARGGDGQGRRVRHGAQGRRRRHPVAWRHRHDLGARSAALFQARQGLRGRVRRRQPGTASASPGCCPRELSS